MREPRPCAFPGCEATVTCGCVKPLCRDHKPKSKER
jgi:hypothetical protein